MVVSDGLSSDPYFPSRFTPWGHINISTNTTTVMDRSVSSLYLVASEAGERPSKECPYPCSETPQVLKPSSCRGLRLLREDSGVQVNS